MERLEPAQWRARRAAHEARVDAWLAPHLARRRSGSTHPVEDFLFTYYSQRPARLRRWHPGAGTILLGAEPQPNYVEVEGGITLDPGTIARKRDAVERITEILDATAQRPAQFGCFGLHEWAMVYRAAERRHEKYPLRLGPTRTDELVEQNPIRCTHYDAFRFFTEAARPLNAQKPDRQSTEQPGCLHATMDLYKWAYKLSPIVASELVADCFALAREVRELDMRASPYDLTALGYRPVRIETPAGRAEYVAGQRAFARRAAPLRQRLREAISSVR